MNNPETLNRGRACCRHIVKMLAILGTFAFAMLHAQNVDSLVRVINHSPSVNQILDARQHVPKNLSKVDMKIMDVIVQLRTEGTTRMNLVGKQLNRRFSRNAMQISDDGNFHAYIYLHEINSSVLGQLKASGINVRHSSDAFRMAECDIPFDMIEALAQTDNVVGIDAIAKPILQTGDYTTAGDAILRANLERSTYGFTGQNVKVGVISDGVDHWTASRDAGYLPSTFQVLRNDNGDEGTAMSEIVHALAPGATLAFRDKGISELDMADGIDELISAGCNVIVDDVLWVTERAFEDGPLAVKVAQIDSSNIKYISCAGNWEQRSWTGQSTDAGNGWMLFSSEPHSECNGIFVPAGQSIEVWLQWANEYKKSRDNYDLFIMDGPEANANVLGASGTVVQDGTNDPKEYAVYDWPAHPAQTVYVRVRFTSVQSARRVKLYAYPYEFFDPSTDYAMWGHATVSSCISVGAMDAANPQYIEDISNRGPARIYSYDSNGYPVSYVDRSGPTVSGIDKVQTYVGSHQPSLWGPGDPVFSGTSAAAPHVAGIVALMLSASPSLTCQQVRDALTLSCTKVAGMGQDYFNNTYGYGRPDACNAVLQALASQGNSTAWYATAWNGNHILEKDASGNLHSVFTSGGEIFYRRSQNLAQSWSLVTRLSAGDGANDGPAVAVASDGTLHAVWQRKVDNYDYQIWYSRSTNQGAAWSAPALIASPEVSYAQSNAGYGQGATPVIATPNGTQSKLLCVWTDSDGLKYRIGSTTAGFTSSTMLVPGDYNAYSVWHPCLAVFGSSSQATLMYDDRYIAVYSQQFNGNANPPSAWSGEAVAGSGYSDRYASVTLNEYGLMYGVWSRWDGNQWIVRYGLGYAYNNTWDWFYDLTVQGLDSYYPVATYWYDDYNMWEWNQVWWSAYRGTTYTVQGADYNWYQGWNLWGGFSGTGVFVNTTHETVSTSYSTSTWTDLSASPYQLTCYTPGVYARQSRVTASVGAVTGTPQNGVKAVPSRSVEIVDRTAKSMFTLAMKGVNFKKFDPRKTAKPTLTNAFSYLQSDDIAAKVGDTLHLDVTISIASPDTAENGEIAKSKENAFGSIQTSLLVMSGGVEIDRMDLLALTQSGTVPARKSIALSPYAAKTVTLVPAVSFQKDLAQRKLDVRIVEGIEILKANGANSDGAQIALKSQLADEAGTPADKHLIGYPNPFNPRTQLRYGLSVPAKVSLVVFDMLGREVATLVNSDQQPGIHFATFDASRLSSGLYVARVSVIPAGETPYTQSVKLSLMK